MVIGVMPCSEEEFVEIMDQLNEEYPGSEYHLLRRNDLTRSFCEVS